MQSIFESYDAIVVLGAVMEWDKSSQRWTFPDIINRYPAKLVIGDKRAEAAVCVAHLTSLILVTGGSDTHPETSEKHSRAVELAKLIVEKGAPSNNVHAIGQVGNSNTRSNVDDIVGYLKTNNGIKKIAILSPLFQFARAKMMLEENPFFHKNGIALHWLLVETILISRYPTQYIPWFNELYTSPEAQTCREMEVQGIKALREKSYNPKS